MDEFVQVLTEILTDWESQPDAEPLPADDNELAESLARGILLGLHERGYEIIRYREPEDGSHG